jgi:hypothetical protein
MTSLPYTSADALAVALVQRLRNAFGTGDLPRRRAEVSYRRLVARLATTSAGLWVIKGGFGLILRLDPSRTSNDIDIAYFDEGAEPDDALAALRRACAAELDDYFHFTVDRIAEVAPDRARRVTVICRLGAREWSRFHVDLVLARAAIESEPLGDAPSLTGIAAIDEIPLGVELLAWPQQIAEKVCAIFEIRDGGPSGRLRDLTDLAMIAGQISNLDGTTLCDTLAIEAAARPLIAALPTSLQLEPEQRREWAQASRRATRGAPIPFDEAERIASQLVNPVLDGSARGHRWDTTTRSWTA